MDSGQCTVVHHSDGQAGDAQVRFPEGRYGLAGGFVSPRLTATVSKSEKGRRSLGDGLTKRNSIDLPRIKRIDG